MGGEKGKTYIH